MRNPAVVLPTAMQAIQRLNAAKESAGVPPITTGLVHLHASQINSCVCVVAGSNHLRKLGDSEDRISAVSAWRDAPWFTDGERAALGLAEATTRLSDRADPVPDEVWAEAARQYDESGLAALTLEIATTSVYNRPNVATRRIAGAWRGSAAAAQSAQAVRGHEATAEVG